MGLMVALCSDHPAFREDRVLDEREAERHYGCSWIPILRRRLPREVRLTTGDRALAALERREILPGEIRIVQEMDARDGARLARLGARPVLLYCLESPLFAPRFYDRVRRVSKPFGRILLFRETLDDLDPEERGRSEAVRFPGWSGGPPPDPIPWKERRPFAMVAANKFSRYAWDLRCLAEPHSLSRWFASWSKERISPSYRRYGDREIQSERLEAIRTLGGRGLLSLRGRGWERRERLPHGWRRRLGPVLDGLAPGPVEDKIGFLAGHRFAVCLENLRMGGYVTEKILHCLWAGAIPVYLGAPDVGDLLPERAFVRREAYPDWGSLAEDLLRMGEEEASSRIRAGREFLASREGRAFSDGAFAERVRALLAL